MSYSLIGVDYREYKVGNDIYTLTYSAEHEIVYVGEKSSSKSYESSEDDIEHLINNELVFDTGVCVRDIKTPVYYLFYKFDITSIIHGHKRENKIKEVRKKWKKYLVPRGNQH